MVVRYGLSLLIGIFSLPVLASNEAQRWTELLRRQDPHASVWTLEDWDRNHDVSAANVTHKLLPEDKSIGYIRIASFDPRSTCKDTKEAIQSVSALGATSLRLDLRGNPGGQRMMAICVAGLFVGPRPIMGLVNVPSTLTNLRDLVEEPYDITSSEVMWMRSRTEQFTALPLVVLIDGETASAAEVVAGVVQDYGRGEVVGARSFGKGTAQDCTNMKGRPDLIICYTIQRFILPSGKTPEGTGITPSDAQPHLLSSR